MVLDGALGQRKVLKLVEKWGKFLQKATPEEILEKAVKVKKVEYIKGNGKPYLELVLEDNGKDYVEVNTLGDIYAQHKDLYVTLRFDRKDVPKLYENLHAVEKLVFGGWDGAESS